MVHLFPNRNNAYSGKHGFVDQGSFGTGSFSAEITPRNTYFHPFLSRQLETPPIRGVGSLAGQCLETAI
jgi:hypothetical protein